jgi:hypothetical protein
MDMQKLKEIGVELMLQQGEVVNTVFIETPKTIVIVPVPLTNPNLKHEQMFIAGLIAAQSLGRVSRVVRKVGFITEAWMSRHLVADVQGKAIPAPSKDPKRIECLVIGLMTLPSKEPEVCVMEIKRHGEVFELIDSPDENPEWLSLDILEAFIKGLQEGAK